jgi:N-acetylglucosamine kinase-like BadF-type ATPase
MEYVLGIDQGSTKTHAALCDQAGHILGVGQVFGACHSLDGMEPAMTAVRSAAEAALYHAGVRAQDVALLFGGLSGLARRVHAAATEHCRARPGGRGAGDE